MEHISDQQEFESYQIYLLDIIDLGYSFNLFGGKSKPGFVFKKCALRRDYQDTKELLDAFENLLEEIFASIDRFKSTNIEEVSVHIALINGGIQWTNYDIWDETNLTNNKKYKRNIDRYIDAVMNDLNDHIYGSTSRSINKYAVSGPITVRMTFKLTLEEGKKFNG